MFNAFLPAIVHNFRKALQSAETEQPQDFEPFQEYIEPLGNGQFWVHLDKNSQMSLDFFKQTIDK